MLIGLKLPPQVKAEMLLEHGVDISTSTAQRRLRESGLHGRKARRKPHLIPAHKRARLEFARAHKDWTASQWLVSPLLGNSPYTFAVAASTVVGIGPYSSPITASTDGPGVLLNCPSSQSRNTARTWRGYFHLYSSEKIEREWVARTQSQTKATPHSCAQESATGIRKGPQRLDSFSVASFSSTGKLTVYICSGSEYSCWHWTIQQSHYSIYRRARCVASLDTMSFSVTSLASCCTGVMEGLREVKGRGGISQTLASRKR